MEDLSETYPPQLTIAIYEKWNHQAHGIKQGEEDYINYFNTKNLALCSFNKEDLIYDGTIDCIDFIHYVRGLEPERTFEINTIIMYRYKNRDFCFKHNGINEFQKLWRKFHYQTMPRYKNIRNLRYRSIYGKFKKQI
tara:strand:- start:162 stop:572 length:411 start_codon:yes stop_codon:yes gene_type:complete